MDPETQQYLELAKTGLDTANKTGLLKGIWSRLPSFKPLQQDENSVDFRRRAELALKENAVEYFASLELTTSLAKRILGADFNLDDIDGVDPTWQKHWTEGATKVGVSDEDRVVWWSRLLAGEIQQPGTFSLRTLAVMDTLSTAEARLFTRLCGYAWNPSYPVLILPPDDSSLWKPDFAEATLLESIGLAKFDSVNGFSVSSRKETGSGRMMFHDDYFQIKAPPGKSVKLRCGPLFLTDIGKEMYKLTSPEYSQSYCEEIVSEWRESFSVQKLPSGLW